MKLTILVGSSRPNRAGLEVATWVADTAKLLKKFDEVKVVDLATLGLTLDGFEYMPRTGKYVSEAHKNWSKLVADSEAFVFVTPEYNGSYSATLKNAVDHLSAEWNNKPAAIVAYSPSGANSVVDILETLLTRIGMHITGELKIGTYPFGFDGETGYAKELNKLVESEYQAQLEAVLDRLSQAQIVESLA